MNKKKIIPAILIVIAIFFAALKMSNKNVRTAVESAKQPIKVKTVSVSQSKSLQQTLTFPANIVGDQEVKITARSAGTIVEQPANVGAFVTEGSLLAKIDDSSSTDQGDAGFKSIQVQQSENAVSQAKKAYQLAKDLYDSVRGSSAATGAQKDSAKAQVKIAKLQYENSLLGLTGNVDNRLLTSPISGIITNKAVSAGDSVSVGQLIAAVSKNSDVKIQFFVDAQQLGNLKNGQEISALDADGNSVALTIRNISSSADQTTKRFLIEAYPKTQKNSLLLAGTVTTVQIENTLSPKSSQNILLPLSVINVGQNENYVLISENGHAKKLTVKIENVAGETAEVSGAFSNDLRIITDGGKLIKDGEAITVQD